MAAGALIVFLLQKSVLKSKSDSILKEAEAEGESIKKDKIIQAKEEIEKESCRVLKTKQGLKRKI